jgi:hypothetical protein
VAIALVLALSASLALDFSDSIFQSRLLPWTVSLIELQSVGFAQASRMFPCRAEGFDTGCEWYKTLPTFVVANAAAYLSVAVLGVYLYRKSERLKTVLRRRLRSVFDGRMFRNHWALLTPVRGEVVARCFYSVGARARRPNAVGCRGRPDGNNSAHVVLGNADLHLPGSSRYSKCN